MLFHVSALVFVKCSFNGMEAGQKHVTMLMQDDISLCYDCGEGLARATQLIPEAEQRNRALARSNYFHLDPPGWAQSKYDCSVSTKLSTFD